MIDTYYLAKWEKNWNTETGTFPTHKHLFKHRQLKMENIQNTYVGDVSVFGFASTGANS